MIYVDIQSCYAFSDLDGNGNSIGLGLVAADNISRLARKSTSSATDILRTNYSLITDDPGADPGSFFFRAF